MKAAASKELIEVDDLRVGMFVHLDMGWMSHPFPLGSFKISSAEQVATIRSLGVQRVRWSPTQSDVLAPVESTGWTAPAELDEPTESTEPGVFALEPQPTPPSGHAPLETPEAAARNMHKRRLADQRSALQLCERQFAEAARDCRALTEIVRRARWTRATRRSSCRRRWSTRCWASTTCASGCCRTPPATRPRCMR